MHAEQFDRLTRVSATSSRRDCLRFFLAGLITAKLRLSGAAASQLEGSLVLGAACSESSECPQLPLIGPVICADNGFTSDGVKNCCNEEFGCCSSDAECCG